MASEAGTLTAGTRWSWQVYPAGVAVRPDGTVALDLKSAEGELVDLYANNPALFQKQHPGAIARYQPQVVLPPGTAPEQ